MEKLKKHIHDDSNGLDYVLVGDYYIPDLQLPEESRPIGRWGRMHREYLQEYCPDGVIVLNNARGGLIVEADLASALHSGKIYAAGLDVVSTEPIQSDSPLLAAPNCIITPHISWAPKECRQRIMDMTADNIQHFISSAPIHVVNR